jgi:hypothetical protein
MASVSRRIYRNRMIRPTLVKDVEAKNARREVAEQVAELAALATAEQAGKTTEPGGLRGLIARMRKAFSPLSGQQTRTKSCQRTAEV